MSDQDDLEELRQQTQPKDRLEDQSGEGNQSSTTEDQPDTQSGTGALDEETSTTRRSQSRKEKLTSDIMDELDAITQGDQDKTVNVWDGEMTALLAVLEEHPEERRRVSETLQEELGVHSRGSSERAEILKMLLRVGLAEADPELANALQEAVKEHAVQTL